MNLTKLICYIGKICFVFKRKNLNNQSIQNPAKILIVRSGAIGDVVMTTSLISSIRKRYPSAEISYLVGNWSKKILLGNPNLNKIISFSDEIIYKKKIVELIKLIKQIRKEKFDLAFIMDKSYHWGILAFLFGIQTRVGFNRKGINGQEGFANNFNVDYDGTKNEIDYNLELASKIGIPIENTKSELFLSEKDELFANEFVNQNKIKGKIIGLIPGGAKNPGQELDLKRWPLEHWIKLIKNILIEQPEINLVLFGGPGDIDISEKIKSELNSEKIKQEKLFDLIGKTSLSETSALMKKCNLIVSPDSGPLHIAYANGVKIIALFGPTPALRFSPKEAIIFQKEKSGCPCYDIYGNYKKCEKPVCMFSIKPEEVYQTITEII